MTKLAWFTRFVEEHARCDPGASSSTISCDCQCASEHCLILEMSAPLLPRQVTVHALGVVVVLARTMFADYMSDYGLGEEQARGSNEHPRRGTLVLSQIAVVSV